MRPSSRVGLLISVFSLLIAMTLGISYSQASQEGTAAEKHPQPVYSIRKGVDHFAPVFLPTWEQKRQMFDAMLTEYDEEGDIKRGRHWHFRH